MTDTSGQLRGYDHEGHKVVVGWVNGDGSEYLVALSHCCDATGKGSESGIVCRACYREVSWELAAEATIARPATEGERAAWAGRMDRGKRSARSRASLPA